MNHLLKKLLAPPNDEFLTLLLNMSRKKGLKIHLTGGAVRDLLLNRTSLDLDFVVNRNALSIAEQFARRIKAAFIPLDAENDTARVVYRRRRIFDFAGYRGKNLSEDLHKRDFTINSIAVALDDLVENRFDPVDPAGGCEDIKKKRIRTASRNNFIDDPLRTLRAFRFKAQLQFQIDEDTGRWLRQIMTAINDVSPERIVYELGLIMRTDRAAAVVEEMTSAGLLLILFPELAPMKNCPQNYFHHLKVLDHTIQVMKNLDALLRSPEAPFTDPFFAKLFKDAGRKSLLRFAALFHDAGKPETLEYRGTGRISFHKHASHSARLASQSLKRKKMSTRDVSFIKNLILLHMRPIQLLELYQSNSLTIRALHRLVKKAGELMPEMLLLSYADLNAAKGPAANPAAPGLFKKMTTAVIEQISRKIEPVIQNPKLVTGNDLINVFSLKPGPHFQKLLDAVEIARIEGTVTDRESALDFLRQLLKNKLLKTN